MYISRECGQLVCGKAVSTTAANNAANMVKRFSLFPMEQLDEDEDDKFDDSNITTAAKDDLCPDRCPCFVHSLQLMVTDGVVHDGLVKHS